MFIASQREIPTSPNDLAALVDRDRLARFHAWERSEISHRPLLPEKRTRDGVAVLVLPLVHRSDDLTALVDRNGLASLAGGRPQVGDHPATLRVRPAAGHRGSDSCEKN